MTPSTDVYADAVQTYDLNELRHKADDFLSYACGYSRGRETTDKVYRAVVENRIAPKYSSCGDLAHWLLFRLGVRETWINRREHANYKIGHNISRLCYLPAPVRMVIQPDEFTPECGDVLVVWSLPTTYDAHVICVINWDPAERVLLTAEYGQPGGKLRRHVIKDEKKLRVGARAIQRWLPLDRVLAMAAPRGRLIPPEEPPQLIAGVPS